MTGQDLGEGLYLGGDVGTGRIGEMETNGLRQDIRKNLHKDAGSQACSAKRSRQKADALTSQRQLEDERETVDRDMERRQALAVEQPFDKAPSFRWLRPEPSRCREDAF